LCFGSVAGAVLIGVPDSKNNDQAPISKTGPFGLTAPAFGDLLEIISAFMYGFYTSLIDVRVAIHNVDMANFLGKSF
jgi:drug/metabolite transporter (DMT)-like permease